MKSMLMAVLCILCYDVNAQKASDGSSAYTFSGNNNHVMVLQKDGGDPASSGDVRIEFYGHMAFKITSPKGLTVLIDPWRNDPTGAFGLWFSGEFPELTVDVVLSSHAHFDHDAIYRPHAIMALDRMAGEFRLGDVKITGVADKHQCIAPGDVKWDQLLRDHFHVTNLCPPDNSASWDNVIYVVETGGIRIGFWGDNRPDPGPQAAALLKGLDVLVMNIDGSQHILSYVQINAILATFKPRAVIPAHYLSGTELPSSSLKNADEWVETQKDVLKLTTPELLLNVKMLSGTRGRVYYFGNNVKTN
jgi:L-ascorbate metabolism protein UlaG (beta-lactamase superfamily)